MKILWFDIETTAIDHWPTLEGLTEVHCLCVYDGTFMRSFNSLNGDINEGISYLNTADYAVGHNAIGFDAPALAKMYRPLECVVLDTMVMARVLFPDLKNEDYKNQEFPRQLVGSHSLKAWGKRIGEEKDSHGETEDWSQYSAEMEEYCAQDVLVTHKLFLHLTAQNGSQQMMWLEHNFARIIRKQEANGWPFDSSKANELTERLMVRRAELKDDLQEMFPATVETMKQASGWTVTEGGVEYSARTKGELKTVLKDAGLKQVIVNRAVRSGNKTKTIPFNPNSRDQICERLVQMGWEPSAYDGKRPKIDEGVLKGIGTPEALMLLEYLLLTKRLGQIAEGKNAWLKLVTPEGRIHGELNTNGAVSGRCTHRNPNVSQVPANRAPYGEECRSCFIAPKGKVLVGADASGLELRCLAHYLHRLDDGAYAREILEGDIHTANQKASGLEHRNQAKTFIYALLYGAGDTKIGEIVGKGRKEGKALKARFFQKMPAVQTLLNDIEMTLEKKPYLTGLDGRKLPCRSAHSALNLLLQSAGAVLMKQALVTFCEDAMLPFELHGNIHDEVQFSCDPENAESLGRCFVDSLAKAGRTLGFRMPVDGEYKVGLNWKETH